MLTKQKPTWVKLFVCGLLLSIPFLAAILDGVLRTILVEGSWRIFMLPSYMIVYIWIISPIVSRMGDKAAAAILSMAGVCCDEDMSQPIPATVKI